MANDETTQFISDALVNNPTLGLASNGAGVVGVFDPKNGFAFKGGFQQSNTDATNLSDSIFSLVEVDYVARPPGLAEGNYRVWFRNDNSTGTQPTGVGRQPRPEAHDRRSALFGRYGRATADERHAITSTASASRSRMELVFNPLDFWGVGYAQTEPRHRRQREAGRRATTTSRSPRSCGCRSTCSTCFESAGGRRRRSGSSCLACGCRRDSSVSLEAGGHTMVTRKTVSHRQRRWLLVVGAALAGRRACAPRDVKVADPTSVVMIVNRDSNDIAFMDIKTKKIVGKTFLGNNVNPHMVMMSPDGRYVVTGGTRANKAYIIDAQHAAAGQGHPGRHRARAPGVLAGQPLVLPGQSGRRLDLGDRHGVADEDQDDSRPRRAAQHHVLCRTARRPTSATTARTGSASSTSGATSC